MRIDLLTIHGGHNATVGVWNNGINLGYFQEERLLGKKNYTGWPHLAIKKAISENKITSVDTVGFGFSNPWIDLGFGKFSENPNIGSLQKLFFKLIKSGVSRSLFMILRKYVNFYYLGPSGKKRIKNYFNTSNVEVLNYLYLDHHIAHGLAAFAVYPELLNNNNSSLIVTADAGGDGFSSKVFSVNLKPFKVNVLREIQYDSSFGLLYAGITRGLGFKDGEDEYKLMGMSGYIDKTNPKVVEIKNYLKELMKISVEKKIFHSKFHSSYYYDNIMKLISKKFKKPLRFDHVIAANQYALEENLIDFISCFTTDSRYNNLVTGGGVFMNVQANFELAKNLDNFQNIFHMPSSGDESIGFGVATYYYLSRELNLTPTNSLYLGENISGTFNATLLDEYPMLEILEVPNFTKFIAEQISKKRIVAVVSGACEFGARALGNRSLFCDASDNSVANRLNLVVKKRDFWMPFAPIIHPDWLAKYVSEDLEFANRIKKSAEYMMTTFTANDLAERHLAAAIHNKTKTMRVQIAKSDLNLEILNCYSEITGMGGFLNTSFNVHGQPLISSISQALDTFKSTRGIDFLAIDNFIVQRKSQD
jgi:carbamoyltransferase